ncbi:hypothetical protein BGX38DRAFT_1285461 [Terfezia claveryi]|nr:hypothetical protein BGX38DRAFT_1285461 [Terfezia claveryi]
MITVRPLRPDGRVAEGFLQKWILRMPKSKRRQTNGEQARKLESSTEGVEEEEEISDNEAMVRKSTMKRRKIGKRDEGLTLGDLEEIYGKGGVDPALPVIVPGTGFEDRGMAGKEGQKEKTRTSLDWVEEETTSILVKKGLDKSKYMVKELTDEEVKRLMEDCIEGQGRGGEKEEDEEIGEDEEPKVGAGGSWKRPCELEPKTEMEIVNAIIENAVTIREVDELSRE